MAAHPQTAYVSLADYLAAEETAEFRSEYIDGRVVAMVGGSFRHNRIIHNLHLALGGQLQGGPCGMVSQGMRLKVHRAERVLYPDVMIYCGDPHVENDGGEFMMDPSVIIEVLSDSTADYDHGTKWESYRRIPTLRDYLLVSQDAPRVERYSRHGDGFWLFSETAGLEQEVRLDGIGVTLRLADVYQGVLPAGEGAGGDASEITGTDA